MVVEADVCIERQSQAVAIEGREGELVLQLSFVEIDTCRITIGIKKAQRQAGLPVGLLIACLLTDHPTLRHLFIYRIDIVGLCLRRPTGF